VVGRRPRLRAEGWLGPGGDDGGAQHTRSTTTNIPLKFYIVRIPKRSPYFAGCLTLMDMVMFTN
jgi:hypothetical protein